MKRLLLLNVLLLFTIIANAQGWGQTQKIVPDDRLSGQQFGWSVAIDGNFAVVGVKEGNGHGEAYVFENDGTGNWIQLQKLESPTPHQFAHFGSAVAISGDYILIGAWGNYYDANGNNFVQGAGAAYVFKKQASGSFVFEQKIVASNRETNNHFGFTLAINGDYAIVGTLRDAYDVDGNNYLENAGAAFVFERDGSGIWNEVQKIVASDRAETDHFAGFGVAINGNYLVVSAMWEDEDENGANTLSATGSAYVFERDGAGIWNQAQKIVASNRLGSELFGSDVSISANYIVVGAQQGNVSAGYTGSVYIFKRDGSGTWIEMQEIIASNAAASDRFGQSVSIDGNKVIIGAYTKNYTKGNTTYPGGAAYAFERDAAENWSQIQYSYGLDRAASDSFGYDVAISGDFAFVGANQEDEDEDGENFLQEAGSVYIFDANETNTITLSIDDVNLEIPFVVYPNPATNYITISSTTKIKNIQLYDLLGKRVLQTSNTNTIQVNHLQKGCIY